MKSCLEKKFVKKKNTKFVTKTTFELMFGYDAPQMKHDPLKYIPVNTSGKVVNGKPILNQIKLR